MGKTMRSILFLGLLGLLLLGASWVFLPKNNTEVAGMQRLENYASGYLSEPENTLDLLALGDSMTAAALVLPELWADHGICGYSVCGPNQALTKGLYYLERFTRNQTPKVVLLEAYELYQPISRELILEDLGLPLIPVLQYHDSWKRAGALDPFSVPHYTTKNPYRGFYADFAQVGGGDTDYMARDKEPENVDPVCMHYLKKIQSHCQKIGARLILFSIPSPESWDWGKHLGTQAAAEALGIPYLDLNVEDLGIDWQTDTTDSGIHLNYLGGTKVTAWMGDYLAATGLLPDRRQDPAYESWNDDLELFRNWVETDVKPVAKQPTT